MVAQPTVDYAVEVYNLRKVYRARDGRQAAVDGLDLRVPLGGIHGFLGPDGSGKTTTIRMLLGLIAADSGHIRILDHEVPLAINDVIGRVGAVVEQPKFFPAFSGQKNLQLLAGRHRCTAAASCSRARRSWSDRPPPGQSSQLLTWHEAAPRHRRNVAQRP
jgi:ABC-type multidrug transport system ATPase subunit